ncbi:MAG: pyridoxamine 5'-phosphate oxidase family protein [Candidatus Nanopelagicales bacterium]
MDHKPPAKLGPGRYIALTSFGPDEIPKTTRVWATKVGGLEYVVADANSAKVQRINANSRVQISACDHSGNANGPILEARARVLGPEFTRVTINWLQLTYGWLFRTLMKVERGKVEKKVAIAIKLSSNS